MSVIMRARRGLVISKEPELSVDLSLSISKQKKLSGIEYFNDRVGDFYRIVPPVKRENRIEWYRLVSISSPRKTVPEEVCLVMQERNIEPISFRELLVLCRRERHLHAVALKQYYSQHLLFGPESKFCFAVSTERVFGGRKVKYLKVFHVGSPVPQGFKFFGIERKVSHI